jgi:hypothetical protein
MLPQDIRKMEWSFIGIDVLGNICVKIKSRSVEKSYLLSEEIYEELLKTKTNEKYVINSYRRTPIAESAIRKIIHEIGAAAGINKDVYSMLLLHNNVTLGRMAGATDDEIINQAGFKYKRDLQKYSDFKPVIGIADKIPVTKILNRNFISSCVNHF